MFYIGRVEPARERATTIQLEILQLSFWYLPSDTIEFFALYTSVRALIFLRRASTCRWKYHYRFFLSFLSNQISIKNRLPFVWVKSDAFDAKQTTASIKRQSTKEARSPVFSHASEHCGSPSMDTPLTHERGRRFSREAVGKKEQLLIEFPGEACFQWTTVHVRLRFKEANQPVCSHRVHYNHFTHSVCWYWKMKRLHAVPIKLKRFEKLLVKGSLNAHTVKRDDYDGRKNRWQEEQLAIERKLKHTS